MSIRFPCENCGQRLSVDEGKVGKRAKCPKCKGAITVPTSEAGAAAMAELSAKRAEAEVEDVFAEFTVYDDSELIYETEDIFPRGSGEVDGVVDRDKVAVSRAVLYSQGILLGVVAVVSFALGVLVGGNTSSNKTSDADADQPSVLTGNVTYIDSSDQRLPDENSVVIAVPQNVRPDEKIGIEGIKLEDAPPELHHPSLLAILQLGGAYARVRVDGFFRLQLSKPGPYFVLIVSRHTLRRQDTQPPPEHLAQMGRYFSLPLELIGPNKHVWKSIRVKGSVAHDHDFGKSRM